jgi:hypothetical protein
MSSCPRRTSSTSLLILSKHDYPLLLLLPMDMTTANTPADRIAQLQASHGWLTEHEARGLLVAIYAGLTNGVGVRDHKELHKDMDEITARLCQARRAEVIHYLSTLPDLMFDGSNPWKE